MQRRNFLIGMMGLAAMATAGCTTNKGGSTTSASAATSASASGGAKLDSVKAAWIYVGPINDGGWTAAHDEGRKKAVSALGGKLTTTYKENVPEGPETTQTIEDLIKDGNKIIFATSFGFGDAMLAAAKKYPDVKFLHSTGAWHNTTPNFGTYYGASEETIYLCGMAAAKASKSGTIGFVAPFQIPEVVRHINAFTLGVQSVNPAHKVKVVWINSWFDPAKERQAAESLISQGADVISNGGDSPAPGEAAKAAGVPWIGYDSDQSANFPEVWLTANIYNWGPYYIRQIQSVLDGTWKKEDYYGNMKDNFCTLAPYGKRVDQATQDLIKAKQEQITAGSLQIFKGPLKDNKGAEKVPAGTTMTPDQLQAVDWLIAGVI